MNDNEVCLRAHGTLSKAVRGARPVPQLLPRHPPHCSQDWNVPDTVYLAGLPAQQ
jgi:hypothetical protein